MANDISVSFRRSHNNANKFGFRFPSDFASIRPTCSLERGSLQHSIFGCSVPFGTIHCVSIHIVTRSTQISVTMVYYNEKLIFNLEWEKNYGIDFLVNNHLQLHPMFPGNHF